MQARRCCHSPASPRRLRVWAGAHHFTQRGDHVGFAGLAGGLLGDRPSGPRTSTVGVDKTFSRAPDRALLGVDLHVRDPVHHRGYVAQDLTRPTAGGAERAGELDQGGPGPRSCRRSSAVSRPRPDDGEVSSAIRAEGARSCPWRRRQIAPSGITTISTTISAITPAVILRTKRRRAAGIPPGIDVGSAAAGGERGQLLVARRHVHALDLPSRAPTRSPGTTDRGRGWIPSSPPRAGARPGCR